ncbi:GGDEF domain-containing protein [Almyronema epifaneia]|uniref:GGDEF domain-containing protein n=1 Tax=Almyronema epifaneia S1 TaxID=2991925 RepID=A0ABW6IB94_9CYAN
MKFIRSIRFKLAIAFVLTSFIAVSLVGAIAHKLLIKSVSQVNADVAFAGFKQDVAAYIERYGSWEAAAEAEPFGKFERRRRAIEALSGQRPLQADDCRPTEVQPPISLLELETADIPFNDRVLPPFKFVLLDPAGFVLLGPNKGSRRPASESWQKQAHPIKVADETVAFAIMDRRPNFNAFDRSYHKAIDQALRSSWVVTSAVALAIGLWLANEFSKPIQQLTLAVKAMNTGNLRQQVKIRSGDEFGILGHAFNQMSTELAQAYEDLEKSHQTIRELSIRDELTQLYNRRYFNEQAEQLMAQAKRYNAPLSVMVGDIDYFKQINDTFSHQVGDRVLQQVARLLVQQTRRADVVARYGGEEFVIAFPETTLAQAIQLCDRLRLSIQTYHWATLHPDLKVTISMGLNAETALGSLEKMISVADAQLYQAKRGGRNQLRY